MSLSIILCPELRFSGLYLKILRRISEGAKVFRRFYKVRLFPGKCTPWFGRTIVSAPYSTLKNISTWEQCGHACQEDQKCISWKWSVPDNVCSTSGCKSCHLHAQSVTLDDTFKTQSWISGTKSCFLSISADCYIG